MVCVCAYIHYQLLVKECETLLWPHLCNLTVLCWCRYVHVLHVYMYIHVHVHSKVFQVCLLYIHPRYSCVPFIHTCTMYHVHVVLLHACVHVHVHVLCYMWPDLGKSNILHKLFHQKWDFAILFSIYNVWITSVLNMSIYNSIISELEHLVMQPLLLTILRAVNLHVLILKIVKMADLVTYTISQKNSLIFRTFTQPQTITSNVIVTCIYM